MNSSLPVADRYRLLWLKNFNELSKYQKRFGRMPEASDSDLNAKELYAWSLRQRKLVSDGGLDDDLCTMLEGIGFDFRGRERFWDQKFESLKEFKITNGRLPTSSGGDTERRLKSWIDFQKSAFRANRLHQAAYSRLESLGVEFRAREVIWDDHFKSVQAFHGLHGRLPYASDETGAPISLAAWLIKQRADYRNKILSQEQVEKLESVEIKWEIYEENWDEFFDAASSFKEMNGRLPSRRETAKGLDVGSWLLRQRQQFKQNNLTADRTTRLQSLNFDLNPDDPFWARLEQLKEFINTNDRLPNSSEVFSDIKIGAWLCGSRSRLHSRPDQVKIKALRSLNAFDMPDQWEEMFALTKAYVEAEGSIPLAGMQMRGKNVGHWVTRERYKLKIGKQPPDRLAKLKAIGVVADAFGNKWLETYAVYCEFLQLHERFPLADETYSGVKLGSWAVHQRTKYSKGELQASREKLLLKIGFEFKLLGEKHDNRWELKFDLTRYFLEDRGHLPKFEESVGVIELGRWLSRQRSRMGDNRYSRDRARRLIAIGVTHQTIEETIGISIEKKCSLLEVYFKEAGSLPSRHEIYRDQKIGEYIRTLRSKMRENLLSSEHLGRLIRIGVVADVSSDNFFKNLNATVEFESQFGTWPQANDEFQELAVGAWLANQRYLFKSGNQTPDRLQLLTEVGIVLDPLKDRFLEKLTVLKQFLVSEKRLPKCGESFAGISVGRWLMQNRRSARLGALTESRLKAFADLGIVLEAPKKELSPVKTEAREPWSRDPVLREKKALAIQMRKEGFSIGIIAKKIDRDATSVCQVLRSVGLGGRSATIRLNLKSGEVRCEERKPRLNPITVLDLRENKNLTHAEIAERLGGTPGQVRAALISIGAPSARTYRKGKYYIDRGAVSELFKDGMKMNKIAAELGCTNKRVSDVLVELGLREPFRKVELTPDLKAEIQNLFLSGMTRGEIIEKMNLPRSAIRKAFNGVSLTRARTKIRAERIVELHRSGLSLGEIAREACVDESLVFRYLKRSLGAEYTKSAISEQVRNEILDLGNQKKAASYTAKALDVPLQTVKAVYQKAGIKIPRGRPAKDCDVKRLKLEGHTVKKIAEVLKVRPQAVRKSVIRQRLVKKHKKWTDHQVTETYQMLRSGKSYLDIMRAYDASPAEARRLIKLAVNLRGQFQTRDLSHG